MTRKSLGRGATTKTVRKGRSAPPVAEPPEQKPRVVSPLEGKTAKQKDLIAALKSHEQVFSFGPPGTGKTFIPVAHATDLLLAREIDQMVFSRMNVPAGPTFGLLPGEMDEKTAEWVLPIYDVLDRRMGRGMRETFVKSKKITFQPFETMRGRSFDDAFIFLDEAQNANPKQIEMFLTRTGQNSRLVVTGDIAQSDIGPDTGLGVALHLIRTGQIDAAVVEFGLQDIVRSRICAQWVKAFWGLRASKQAGKDLPPDLPSDVPAVAELLSKNPFRPC